MNGMGFLTTMTNQPKKKNGLMRELFGTSGSWYGTKQHATIIFELLEHGGPINRRTLRDAVSIHYSQIQTVLDELQSYRIVKQFKRGNAKMVELNKKSDIVKAIKRLQRACAKEQMIHEL